MATTKKVTSDYEKRIQLAIAAIKAGQESNVLAASESFDVNCHTQYRRLAGTTISHTEAYQEQQRLTSPEENAIIKWCSAQDDISFPPRLDMVKDMALPLEFKRTSISPSPIGHNWMSQFLK